MKATFERIRHQLKYYFDLIYTDNVRRNMLQALPFWVASLIAGLVAVGYASLFGLAEKFAAWLIDGRTWVLFIITPVCFLASWLIAKKFAPTSRGSGIPQVMAAIELSTPATQHRISRLLSFRIMVTKVVSSIVMVIGGGAVGREGPTIQIAGSIYHIIHKIIPSSWPRLSRQNFILTGAAAGLSAAFNTPLGGIVFAVEELARIHIRYFRTALFTSVIIAGLTAQAILGPYLYLGYPDTHYSGFYIFGGVLLTAVLAGLAGSYMCKLILRLMRFRAALKSTFRIALFVGISALLVAAIAVFLDRHILGSGRELMTDILFGEDKYVSWHTVIFRVAGPVISFCAGGAGGVFAPSLAAGASIGSLVADFFDLAGSNANILILSGMVGFLVGVTRAPFTSAILVLEMTDRHNVIFILMIAALLANIVSLLIDKHSFYDQLKQGYIREVSETPVPEHPSGRHEQP